MIRPVALLHSGQLHALSPHSRHIDFKKRPPVVIGISSNGFGSKMPRLLMRNVDPRKTPREFHRAASLEDHSETFELRAGCSVRIFAMLRPNARLGAAIYDHAQRSAASAVAIARPMPRLAGNERELSDELKIHDPSLLRPLETASEMRRFIKVPQNFSSRGQRRLE